MNILRKFRREHVLVGSIFLLAVVLTAMEHNWFGSAVAGGMAIIVILDALVSRNEKEIKSGRDNHQ